ncbi:hypothetical protein BH23GEM11_BH23GEM11_13510 [soil metagenome]
MKRTVILLVVLALAACGRGQSSPPPAAAPGFQLQPPTSEPYPAPQRLYYDNGGGIQDSLRVVVREEGGLRARWEQATSRQTVPPPPPEVDFGRDMVVLVSAGRMTTEDQIRVDSATVTRSMDQSGEMQSVLVIHVRTTRGCGRFNVDAFPIELLRLRRFDGEVRFSERSSQAEGCGEETLW